MIPTLLWRCPYCSTNDALIQEKKMFRPLTIRCTDCQTVWQVRRVIGDDYWMKLISSDQKPDEIGIELPLAHWYDRMKETISLSPIENKYIALESDEFLYLASGKVVFYALSNDPRFANRIEAEIREDAEITRWKVGQGRVYLTSQRMIWQEENGEFQDFSLEKINSFYTAFNFVGLVMVEQWLYQINFLEDSLLKWVSYFGEISKVVKESTGHMISTSKY